MWKFLFVAIERSSPWVGLDPVGTIWIWAAYRHKPRCFYWNHWIWFRLSFGFDFGLSGIDFRLRLDLITGYVLIWLLEIYGFGLDYFEFGFWLFPYNSGPRPELELGIQPRFIGDLVTTASTLSPVFNWWVSLTNGVISVIDDVHFLNRWHSLF